MVSPSPTFHQGTFTPCGYTACFWQAFTSSFDRFNKMKVKCKFSLYTFTERIEIV